MTPATIANRIRELRKRTCADVIEIGRLLVEAKEPVGHGFWRSWLRDEFAWSTSTAGNFVAVFKTFGKVKTPTIAHLDLTSLYDLARPSTPTKALGTVLRQLEAGAKPPSVAEVRRIIRDAKPTPVVAPKEKPPSIRDAALRSQFTDAVAALRTLCSRPCAVFIGAASAGDLTTVANFLEQVANRQTAGRDGRENEQAAKAVSP